MQKTIQEFEVEKEISMLYTLGLEDYEIDYLLSMKAKQEASKKLY